MRAAVFVFLAMIVWRPLSVESKEIGPEADWCREANTLPAGAELLLRPGDYQGPCSIRGGEGAVGPISIRAKDPDRPARIVYSGGSHNVLNIHRDDVTIRGLEFGPTLQDVDGIRIYDGNGITIEDCRFSQMGGIAVVANHVSVRDLTIRRNSIRHSKSTAMYFGCHDGISCTASNLVIEQNFIDGVDTEQGIGYGIQIKLNSTATIRDNVIVNTKGPGIMVYGAADPSRVSLVERNLVSGSRTSSGIVLGGGPAVVRNNVALANAEVGVGLEDYRRRGLLQGILVAHNTLYGNSKGAIGVPAYGRLEAKVINNAAHARSGTRALPPDRSGLLARGNVDCSLVPCFGNPKEMDFSPHATSPLVGRGRSEADQRMPVDDYLGRRRGEVPTPGAFDGAAEPIVIGIQRGEHAR